MTDSSREISLDAFAPDPEPVTETTAEPPKPPTTVRIGGDPAARARAEHEQMVMGVDPGTPAGDQSILYERQPDGTFRPVEPNRVPLPVAIIYPSRSGGESPHVVTLALWKCTCEAAVLGNRDCWAISEVKRMFEGAR